MFLTSDSPGGDATAKAVRKVASIIEKCILGELDMFWYKYCESGDARLCGIVLILIISWDSGAIPTLVLIALAVEQ